MNHNEARQANLDAAQRELDRRAAEGEDVSLLRVNPKTYAIEKAGEMVVIFSNGVFTVRRAREVGSHRPLQPERLEVADLQKSRSAILVGQDAEDFIDQMTHAGQPSRVCRDYFDAH